MSVQSHHQLDSYVQEQIESYVTLNTTPMLLIALSGGVDSIVLLNCVANLRKQFAALKINALHVNHGIHPDALSWAEHCQRVCDSDNIDFVLSEHNLKNVTSNREATYRKKRYQSFAQQLPESGILLTAHHQHDQAETVLYNLFRGSGVSGLTGMKPYSRFAKGFHLRPLLSVPKQLILDYADHNKLSWVEDPSNADTDQDRNYIRHNILPEIIARWPAADATIQRTATLLNDSKQLLDEVAQQDIDECQSDNYPGVIKNAYLSVLELPMINRLSKPRKINLIKHWAEAYGNFYLTAAQLEQIDRDICRSSKPGLFESKDYQIRSFKNHLYLMRKMSPMVNTVSKKFTATNAFRFADFEIELSNQQGLEFELKPRLGGETILNNSQHQSVKNIFQHHAIPNWERQLIPLVFYQNCLIAIPGVIFADNSPIDDCSISKII